LSCDRDVTPITGVIFLISPWIRKRFPEELLIPLFSAAVFAGAPSLICAIGDIAHAILGGLHSGYQSPIGNKALHVRAVKMNSENRRTTPSFRHIALSHH